MNISTTTLVIRVLLFILILVAIDLYVFKGIKTAFNSLQSERSKQLVYWTYWVVNSFLIIGLLYALFTFDRHNGPNKNVWGFLGAVLILFLVPKLLILFFLLLEDIYRLLIAFGLFIGRMFGNTSADETSYFVSRRQFLSQLAVGLSAIPFVSILYGITKGKYKYTVHRETLTFKDLPDEFDGLTITQLSDIHVGSFDDKEAVERGIQLVNEQKSDLIFFTGDFVNNLASELEPWVDTFKKLSAPMGLYSILGNHDYADYVFWETESAKQANLEKLKSLQKEIGFKLLLNESIPLEKNGQSINLIGLENWGTGGFAKYGNLNKALLNVAQNSFNILLSHDPSHWDAQTLQHEEHIHLTLAGHTHGMQFGVEIPGIKWSPVKFRYPRWAGLYVEINNNALRAKNAQDNKKYLYVNRGFGFIGFHGRVGIWPEITVITLRKER